MGAIARGTSATVARKELQRAPPQHILLPLQVLTGTCILSTGIFFAFRTLKSFSCHSRGARIGRCATPLLTLVRLAPLLLEHLPVAS